MPKIQKLKDNPYRKSYKNTFHYESERYGKIGALAGNAKVWKQNHDIDKIKKEGQRDLRKEPYKNLKGVQYYDPVTDTFLLPFNESQEYVLRFGIKNNYLECLRGIAFTFFSASKMADVIYKNCRPGYECSCTSLECFQDAMEASDLELNCYGHSQILGRENNEGMCLEFPELERYSTFPGVPEDEYVRY